MAGIIFGCIAPHPPLLFPGVGRGSELEVKATSDAMEKLSELLAQSRPETVLVISPHGVYHHDAMGIATANSSSGDMRSWGTSGTDYHFENDLDVVAAIQEEAMADGIPIRSIGERGYELDHGVLVPIYFLAKGMSGASLVPLTFCWLPLERHFAFGRALRRAAERLGKRVAIIASGDLSHRLIPSAPAGYHPEGKVFDEKLVEAIGSYDVPAVLNMDEELIEHAGECGLRSITIMLGALEGLSVKSSVLSYEGPFGVGYLVAALQVDNPGPMHPLVRLAKQTIESYVRDRTIPRPDELTPEMKERAGVFVSLKVGGMLRGCIGTYEPMKENVAEEIITNAISSATRDHRFPEVTAGELPDLEYSVDVLTRPEPVESEADLDHKRYGVIVESRGRKGLLLPDLEGVNTVQHQIEICRSKAGIMPSEPVKLYRFEVKRYK